MTAFQGARRGKPRLALCLLALVFHAFAEAGGTITVCNESSLDAALAGGGLVTFSCVSTINLTTTKVIDVDTTLEAVAGRVTLTTSAAIRLFEVRPGVRLTLRGLTLANGKPSAPAGTNGSNGTSAFGGAIFNDGGNIEASGIIFTNHALTAGNGSKGVVQSEGQGGNGGVGGTAYGGALYNLGGSVYLTNCTFVRNRTTGGRGGDGSDAAAGVSRDGGTGGAGGRAGGAAIYNSREGAVVAVDCSFTDNLAAAGSGGFAGLGGGGFGFPGDNGNPGWANSGALFNDGGVFTASHCTFNGNVAIGGDSLQASPGPYNSPGSKGLIGGAANGGGVFNSGGSLALTNCTFYTNTVTGGRGGTGGAGGSLGFGGDGGDGGPGGSGNGGALYNQGGGEVTLVNMTFARNSATGGAGGAGGTNFTGTSRPGQAGARGLNNGGAIANGGGALTLVNTLLAYNTNGNFGAGPVLDLGGNLSSDASPGFSSPDSVNETDPLLAGLANNGGLTLTAALLAGSPAINHGIESASPPDDQRRYARFGRPDSGAYEFNAAPASARLSVRIEGLEVILSWPAAVTGYTLQLTPTLNPVNWLDVTNVPIQAGFEFVVTNALTPEGGYYRLRK